MARGRSDHQGGKHAVLVVNINETIRAILDHLAEYASEMAPCVHSLENNHCLQFNVM
jgi:hypothetical protein